jgi:hypothetical protein
MEALPIPEFEAGASSAPMPTPTAPSPAGPAVVIREVNDSIRDFAFRSDTESDEWEFICECDDPACRKLVGLTLHEYDERRGAAPPEAVLADHTGPGTAPGI